MHLQPLIGQIRGYAWGSRSAIAAMQSRPVPSAAPEAELWLGAHPGAPARLGEDTGPVLPELIEQAARETLGARVLARFGARLPYLMKLLAAEAPLSWQTHPDATRARAAYAAGLPGYTDPYHKPELLVALGEFEALCGFRDPATSADVLAALRVPRLAPMVAALGSGTEAQRLRGAVTWLLSRSVAQRGTLVAEVVAAGHPLAVRLAKHYPDDQGVLLALLLNEVRLADGEAVFMPAGAPHAYVRGTGVEIMAASDNVLRGGLTAKPVDVPELLRVLRFEVLDSPVRQPIVLAPGLWHWPVPVEEFVLHRADPAMAGGSVALPGDGPRVVLCVRGRVSIGHEGRALVLTAGRAAFAPAGGGQVTVTGMGDLFQASVS